MSGKTIQLRRKGSLTLPANMRRKYDLSEDDVFTLEDLGEGSFLIVPGVSQVARLGDRVAEGLQEEGIDIEEMLAALDQEREIFYREHYVEP